MPDAQQETLSHPRATPSLIGHAAAEAALLDAYNADRLHHAWLITGPRGVGKATLAYRFARFLLSRPLKDAGASLFGDGLEETTPESLELAPDHPVFRRVAACGHADLVTVERALDEARGRRRTEIVVDDIRKLHGFYGQTAAEGGWRVVVIDAADEMNRNAANALLKILEEPPANSVLLLVAHAPGRLLPTIRSRCRHLPLRPLSSEAIGALVAERYPELSSEDTEIVGRLAEGTPGRAVSLIEDGGLEVYQETIGLIRTLPKLDMAGVHRFAGTLSRPANEGQFRAFRDLFTGWLGRAVCFGATGRPLPGLEGEAVTYEPLGGSASLDRLTALWEKVAGRFAAVDTLRLDRKQVVLTTFIGLQDVVVSGGGRS